MSRLTDESHCGAISIYLAEERSSKRGLEAPILCAAFESKVRKNPKHTQLKTSMCNSGKKLKPKSLEGAPETRRQNANRSTE